MAREDGEIPNLNHLCQWKVMGTSNPMRGGELQTYQIDVANNTIQGTVEGSIFKY